MAHWSVTDLELVHLYSHNAKVPFLGVRLHKTILSKTGMSVMKVVCSRILLLKHLITCWNKMFRISNQNIIFLFS